MSVLKHLVHDPLTRFMAQAVSVIVASRLLGLVSKWVGQPLVIAEITAGILLGPSLVGLLFPDASQVLFAPESLVVLQVVSQVGLILFMFLVGLELDPQMLKGRGHTSVLISHTSIIVPFVLGVLLAIYLYPLYSDASVPFTAFSLFLGAAMSITAFPVLARILTERRLLRTRVGAVTITCAAVDDVTAWCVLAFVVAVARSSGMAGAAWTTAWALAYIAAMWWGVRPLLHRLAQRTGTAAAMSQNVVAAVLVLVFLSAWATELIGIHALFGAFLFGAIFPKEGGFAHALAEKLEDLVVIVFLPLFFAFSGLRTELGLLNSAGDWVVCAVVIFVACLGKFGGSAIPARLTGLSWREASALGILMNTRGLMELIVLNLGLDLGVISPTVFTMMVLMALVTTFITTPILKWVYPDDAMARDLIEATEKPPPLAAGDYRVLVCASHASSGPSLLTLANYLAGPGEDRIFALHLKPPEQRESELIGEEAGSGSSAVLDSMVTFGRSLGVEVRPMSFVSPEPAQDICRVAGARAANLVLLGLHKPLFSQTYLGGVVHEVMQAAPADVAVLVDRGLGSVKTVLVPFQGSQHDRAALGLARRLMRNQGASIVVLHVVRPERQGAREMVRTVFGEAHGEVAMEVVRHSQPAQAVLERCRKGIDLVVVGLGADWGLQERRFGLQPERLIRECPIPLLIVRDRSQARAERPPADTVPTSERS
ncbi:MAG: hypothetical protein AMXMBFR7_47460 [Planctomycetota bacterium]